MVNFLRPAVLLAIVFCAAGTEAEEERAPKAIKHLNTFVVGANNIETLKAVAPAQTRTQLTISSEPPQLSSSLPDTPTGVLSTKTIYGFLDFTTTVGDTVMVFTPGASTAPKNDLQTQSALAASAQVPAPSPSPTLPQVVSTSAAAPERRLRFTSATPEPSIEAETTPAPPAARRAGKNLLWAKLRDRAPTDRRPFILPQRRALPSARSAASVPTPPLRREFLSARPASVVADTTSAPTLRTSVVGLVTATGGTEVSGDLTTVHTTSVIGTVVDGSYAQLLQSSSVIFSAPVASPTVTLGSSVIRGSATEFPQLPAPASEPEVLPIEQLFGSVEESQPDVAENRVDSLQERLKARLQAALEARPSREVAAPQRRPFTLLPEQRGRSARPFRPEIPLAPRRAFSGRLRNNRRLSAADRLKQRLLQQRESSTTAADPSAAAAAEKADKVELPSPPKATVEPTEPLSDPENQRVIAVNTFRPKDATDYHYVLTTLKRLHHITIGRFTRSQWLTDTKTRTVHVKPTATERVTPAIMATALPNAVPKLEKLKHGAAVMLPAVQLDPSAPSLPLKTMTETYSTTQLVLKSSVIPLVIGDSTQAFTLTQSYQVTRLVTALKTMPPMEVFRTAAPPGLLDRDRLLVAQSSENQVDALGVPVLRVPPPDDLAAIGLFDADRHESQAHPEMFQLQKQATAAPNSPTPALPQLGALGGLGALGPLAHLAQMSPQQLAYMQLLGPYLAALQGSHGLQQPQLPLAPPAPRTIVTSSPVLVSTVTTSVRSRAIVVTFRATPSTAYITSTTVFPTVLTSYVTSTVHMPALG